VSAASPPEVGPEIDSRRDSTHNRAAFKLEEVSMSSNLIAIWGPQMRRALLIYFSDHGIPQPDPADVGCLSAIGILEINRRSLAFNTTSFLGMASLLVPAFLDSKHIRHKEIAAAVKQCKGQIATTSESVAGKATPAARARGPLAETVKSASTAAKLPMFSKTTKKWATLAATKAAPRSAGTGKKGSAPK
jgi:hypothetical protein